MSKTYKHLVWDNDPNTQVQSAVEDGAGHNIENTYAKQDGYYAEMSVGLADNLISSTLVKQDGAYIFRPTANNVSIESGKALLNLIRGNIVEPVHTEESLTYETTNPNPHIWLYEYAFFAKTNTPGSYVFTVTDITSQWIDEGAYLCSVQLPDGIIETNIRPTVYGLNMNYQGEGTPFAIGDIVTVTYTQASIGTFTTINPTQFKSVGFNLYNHSTGTARLVGNNTYKIVGSYSSLNFVPFGSETAQSITPNDGVFTVSEDGVLTVIDGDATTTMVYLPWSYISTSFDYTAYSESTISIPNVDKDGNALRNNSSVLGFIPAVIIDGKVIAQDIINLQEKKYIANVEYIAYSAANLATVQALPNVKYIYDENTIIYVSDNTKPQVIELANTVTNSYIANDFGTEEFVGVAYNSSIGVPCQNEYGDNLKDKLRSDVLTISAQELTTEQQTQVKQNLGLEITTGVDAFRDLY